MKSLNLSICVPTNKFYKDVSSLFGCGAYLDVHGYSIYHRVNLDIDFQFLGFINLQPYRALFLTSGVHS